MKTRYKSIAVLGAGAWGTTLAKLLGEKGVAVRLWARRPELAESINQSHENSQYLTGISLPDSVIATSDLASAIDGADLWIYAIPSKFSDFPDQLLSAHKKKPTPPILVVTKGLLNHPNHLFLDTYLLEKFSTEVAILSGPNLALEIAQEHPAAAVIAATNATLASKLQAFMSGAYFRAYTSDDVRGVCLGGILKNSIAIAAGISDGLELGDNAKATLLTRALTEMKRIGVALGGRSSTFDGLSGLGDLLATCASQQSRNWQTGYRLVHPESILSSHSVAEGVRTTEIVHKMAKEKGIEIPIFNEIHSVLSRQKTPKSAIESLMLRDLKPES